MPDRMRWIFVATVALLVILADQWTKFLAVRDLTPGVREAHVRAIEGGLPAGDPDLTQQLGYFYGAVSNPCDHRGFVYPRCETISFIDGFWAFRYVENKGAAWGLFAGVSDRFRVPLFYAISIAALVFIFGYLRKLSDRQRMMAWGLSLVLGGALGNFVDRLHLQYVIDFIDWYAGSFHWPTFNVADAAISTGVGLLILDSVLEPKRKPEPEPAARGASEVS
ncbi:MAG: signal peptidase II [Deltaproteobacteria bacterium]|nr:signal peptidase II [Deltaproteobacteria bacterium]